MTRSSLPVPFAVCFIVAACGPTAGEGGGEGREGEEGEGEGEGTALTAVAGSSSVTAVVTVDGAKVLLNGIDHTYLLDVAVDAVAADTEITLTEVTVPEVPGSASVRFAPDGLAFAVPAVLSVDADDGDDVFVGLTFEEGGTAAAQLASPSGDGLAMIIEHFSDALVAPVDAATPVLSDEERASIAFESREQARAIALRQRLNARVLPDIERADQAFFRFHDAARALLQLQGDMQLGGLAEIDVGGATLDALVEAARARLTEKAITLLHDRSAPTCVRGRDVIDLIDFVDVTEAIHADMQLLGIQIDELPSCVTAELTVAGPTSLSADDDTVALTATLLLRGFDDTTEHLDGAFVEFTPTGATGPATAVLPNDNVTSPQIFTRPAAPRAPVVSVVVSARSTAIDLERVPAPAPVVFTVQEPLVASVVIGDPALTPPSTTDVCGFLTNGADAVDRFSVTWSLIDPLGGIAPTNILTTTGDACVRYTTPATAPQAATVVTVLGVFDVDGVVVGSATAPLTVEPQSPCIVADSGAVTEANETSGDTHVHGVAIDHGVALDEDDDRGGLSSSLTGGAQGMSYSASATASLSGQVSVDLESSGTSAPDQRFAEAFGEASAKKQVAILTGIGNGHARITFRVQGEVGDGGSVHFTGSFDPDDDVGGDSNTLDVSGPQSVSDTVVVDTDFSINTGQPIRIYVGTELNGLNDANVTATVTAASVSMTACTP